MHLARWIGSKKPENPGKETEDKGKGRRRRRKRTCQSPKTRKKQNLKEHKCLIMFAGNAHRE